MEDFVTPQLNITFYNASHAYFWSEAVIYQGETTIETARKVVQHFAIPQSGLSEHDVMRIKDQMQELAKNEEEFQRLLNTLPKATLPRDHEFQSHFLLHMHEHFFANALGKSIDFLGKLSNFGDILKDILNSIGGPQVALDLRNMREHDDEYIAGNGHAQNRFITRNDELSIITDATSTCIDFENRQYILGGKINLFQTVDVYERVIRDIQKVYYYLRGF